MQFQSTSPDGIRRLFAGTQSTISYLDNDTSEWTEIASGLGATGSRFKAAGLRDKIVFTNNEDEPRIHTLGSSTSAPIPELQAQGYTKAKVVLEYNGVMVLMNVEKSGERFASRIVWSDYNDATKWNPGTPGTVAGFQDLAYGEEILNAIIFNGIIWVFTSIGIKKMFLSVSADSIFGWSDFYSEPRNRTACLAYENTLVSSGKALYWMGRDSVYTINQYLAAPVSEEWLLKASGKVFEGAERIDTRCCTSAVGEYKPDTKEIWFSYARLSSVDDDSVTCLNDYTLVLCNNDELSIPVKTGDFVNHGFTSFVNFGRSTETGQECNANSVFIGASAEDYCLKSIGAIFQHSMVSLVDSDPVNDIPDSSYTVTARGYQSRIVGLIPAGYPNDEKIIRACILDHETVESDGPNNVSLRIGNSYHLADPVDVRPNCSVLWNDPEFLPLDCPDGAAIATMKAANQRPDAATEFKPYEQGRYLFWDITVLSPSGGDPVGSDSAWQSVVFDVTKI